jgi:plasmid stabilization system protein ParE
MSAPNNLIQVFSHPAVRDLGATLRRSLRMNDDYASILDFEFAETPEAFAEALKRFLRRFEGLARRKNLRRPTQESLEEIAKLVDRCGVKLVRAALISHALVKTEREEEQTNQPDKLQALQRLSAKRAAQRRQPLRRKVKSSTRTIRESNRRR